MVFGATTTSVEAITLPNAPTWACMGLVLVVMIFFRFRRPLRLRNWDILLLFVMAVPMLYLRHCQEVRDNVVQFWRHPDQLTRLVIGYAPALAAAPLRPADPAASCLPFLDQYIRQDPHLVNNLAFERQAIWGAYFWLLLATALLLARSLADLGLERKGEFRPNVTTGGLIWFTCVLLAIMVAKPFLPPWQGVPQQQHTSIVLKYLQDVLTNSIFLPWGLALLSHALIITMLILIGITIFRNAVVGAAAATLYLLLPYTALLLLDASQVVPSVFIVLAILLYRWPMWAGFSLGLGTCFGFFPAILLPTWFTFYWRRGHWRFLLTALAVVLGMVVFLAVTVGLAGAWETAWRLTEWQVWRFQEKPASDSLWNTVSLHTAYRVPLFILFLALVVTSAIWPHPRNLGQLIAWSAVLVLGVQFWYADAGGIYILWYLPLLILQTLRPALTDCRPAQIEPETDRLTRLLRRILPRRPAPDHQQFPPPTALAG